MKATSLRRIQIMPNQTSKYRASCTLKTLLAFLGLQQHAYTLSHQPKNKQRIYVRGELEKHFLPIRGNPGHLEPGRPASFTQLRTRQFHTQLFRGSSDPTHQERRKFDKRWFIDSFIHLSCSSGYKTTFPFHVMKHKMKCKKPINGLR